MNSDRERDETLTVAEDCTFSGMRGAGAQPGRWVEFRLENPAELNPGDQVVFMIDPPSLHITTAEGQQKVRLLPKTSEQE